MTVQLTRPWSEGLELQPHERAVTIVRSEIEAIEQACAFAAEFAFDAAERELLQISPAAEIEAVSAAGLLAITVPRNYGGSDVRASTVAEVLRILATTDPSVARIPVGHFAALNLIRLAGTPRQCEQIFGEVLAGGRLVYARPRAENAHARLTPIGSAGFVLDGIAHDCPGAQFADRVAVVARLDDPNRIAGLGADEYVAYLPAGTTGMRVEEGRPGEHAASATVRLDHVQVAREWLVPRGAVLHLPHSFAAYAQLLRVAVEVGAAQAYSDETSRTAAEAAMRTAGERVDEALAMPHEQSAIDAAIAVAAATERVQRFGGC